MKITSTKTGESYTNILGKIYINFNRYYSYFKKHMTNKQRVEAILELESCEELKINYDIYRDFLKILNELHNDYKKALNDWLDHIFKTEN